MIQVLYYPLPDAFLVENMLAGKQHCLLHVLVAHSAGQVIEIVQLLVLHLPQQTHCLRKLLDTHEGVESLLDVGDDLEAPDNGDEDKVEPPAQPDAESQFCY